MRTIFDHINGEIHMFHWCYLSLKNGLKGEMERVTEESFLLHARNLYEFLYVEKNTRYPYDTRAVDFLGQIIPVDDKFPVLKDRMDVQLSHISSKRLDSGQVSFKNEYDYIYTKINQSLVEYNKQASSAEQLLFE